MRTDYAPPRTACNVSLPEWLARLEMQGRGAPGGQRQPLAVIRDDIAQMLAADAVALKVVVGDHERVIAGSFVRFEQAQREVIENVRFVGRGLRAGGFGFSHVRERKKVGSVCSAKSLNPLLCKMVPPDKRATCIFEATAMGASGAPGHGGVGRHWPASGA
jgi:hypothetical protein